MRGEQGVNVRFGCIVGQIPHEDFVRVDELFGAGTSGPLEAFVVEFDESGGFGDSIALVGAGHFHC